MCWIKLHRGMTEWGWYKDSNTVRVFLHLLLTANYKDGEYLGRKILRGQVVFGRKELAAELCISEKSVRTALEHLKSTGELATQTASKYTVGTIVNYSKYQDVPHTDGHTEGHSIGQETASKGPAKGQQVATSKNIRMEEEQEIKKEIPPIVSNDTITPTGTSRFKPPTVEEVTAYCLERRNCVDPQKWHDSYASKGWMVGKSPMKDWKAAVRTWERSGYNQQTNQSANAAEAADTSKYTKGWGVRGRESERAAD